LAIVYRRCQPARGKSISWLCSSVRPSPHRPPPRKHPSALILPFIWLALARGSEGKRQRLASAFLSPSLSLSLSLLPAIRPDTKRGTWRGRVSTPRPRPRLKFDSRPEGNGCGPFMYLLPFLKSLFLQQRRKIVTRCY